MIEQLQQKILDTFLTGIMPEVLMLFTAIIAILLIIAGAAILQKALMKFARIGRDREEEEEEGNDY